MPMQKTGPLKAIGDVAGVMKSLVLFFLFTIFGVPKRSLTSKKSRRLDRTIPTDQRYSLTLAAAIE